jgi:ABC-type uncharacterized transport system permease subunit
MNQPDRDPKNNRLLTRAGAKTALAGIKHNFHQFSAIRKKRLIVAVTLISAAG